MNKLWIFGLVFLVLAFNVSANLNTSNVVYLDFDDDATFDSGIGYNPVTSWSYVTPSSWSGSGWVLGCGTGISSAVQIDVADDGLCYFDNPTSNNILYNTDRFEITLTDLSIQILDFFESAPSNTIISEFGLSNRDSFSFSGNDNVYYAISSNGTIYTKEDGVVYSSDTVYTINTESPYVNFKIKFNSSSNISELYKDDVKVNFETTSTNTQYTGSIKLDSWGYNQIYSGNYLSILSTFTSTNTYPRLMLSDNTSSTTGLILEGVNSNNGVIRPTGTSTNMVSMNYWFKSATPVNNNIMSVTFSSPPYEFDSSRSIVTAYVYSDGQIGFISQNWYNLRTIGVSYTNVSLFDDTWHMITFVYRASISSCTEVAPNLYQDCIDSGLVDGGWNFMNMFVDGVLTFSSYDGYARPIYLDGFQTYANGEGNVDELGIWDRVLTQEDIDELYNGGLGFNFIKGIPSCTESWSSSFTSCSGGFKTKFYTDANTCGTFNDLPVDNNTQVICVSGGGGGGLRVVPQSVITSDVVVDSSDTTSALSKFFNRIWDWITGIFS